MMRVSAAEARAEAADITVPQTMPAISEVPFLKIPDIKQRLQQRGVSCQGRTRKQDLQDSLLASYRRERQSLPGKLVAIAGEKGRVVQSLYKDKDGEDRFDFSFNENEIAAPDVARRALAKLAREGVQLGTRHRFLHELQPWHMIVQEGFVDEAVDVLRQVPGREHVHVRERVTIELDIEDDDEEDFLDVSHLVRSLEEMMFMCASVSLVR
jgi:hypothetical protein